MDRRCLRKLASVLITTKDRRDDLSRAIDSVLSQTVPAELLVVDDGSSDGTSDMLRAKYPQVRLLRNESPLGIIAARNRAAQEISTDILFTLDDDAAFSDSEVVRRAVEDFQHPRVGAVAIPLVNHINGERQVIDSFMDDATGRQSEDFLCTFAYRGGANALRRIVFLQLGGYDGTGRQGEEHTFCAKLLSAGYVVRIATHGHVDHYPASVRRDLREMVRYRAQNGLQFIWTYVPLSRLIIHMPVFALSALRLAVRKRQILAGFTGLTNGFRAIVSGRCPRRPMSRGNYQLMRKLVSHVTLPFSKVEPHLATPPANTELPPTSSRM